MCSTDLVEEKDQKRIMKESSNISECKEDSKIKMERE